MEPHLDAWVLVPLLAQSHADISQHETPRPRSEKRVHVKLEARHARDSRRQRNKCPDDGQQARNQHRNGSAALEKPIGDIEFPLIQEYIPAKALYQRASAEVADLI